MTKTIIEKIYRFPVKGIPAQNLNETPIMVGTGIPLDRRYAITKGTTDSGEWMPARSFYINARTDGMSKFKLEQVNDRFHITNPQGMEVVVQPDDPDSLAAANEQMVEFMRPVGLVADAPAPKLIDRKGKQSNWDYDDTPISIINAESVKEISKVLDVDLDPLRFRGNLVVSGLPAWEEFSWMGKRIKIGTVEFDVHRPIDRCPTPGVNPENGERDVEVTPGIQEHFGHIHCGMYAKVVTDGKLQEGDAVEIIADAELNWTEAATENASDYALWPRIAKVAACEAGETYTRFRLETATPWPLPQAQEGQRLRLHIGPGQWASHYLTSTSPDHYELEVEDSKTGDPVTAILRRGILVGQTVIISGPFGKVKK